MLEIGTSGSAGACVATRTSTQHIVRLMPYIKSINNDALHNLISAFEQSTQDAYQEYERLVQKGIITVASAHA